MAIPEEVLRYWFEEIPPSAWFRPGAEGDQARAFAGDAQALQELAFLQQPGSRF